MIHREYGTKIHIVGIPGINIRHTHKLGMIMHRERGTRIHIMRVPEINCSLRRGSVPLVDFGTVCMGAVTALCEPSYRLSCDFDHDDWRELQLRRLRHPCKLPSRRGSAMAKHT